MSEEKVELKAPAVEKTLVAKNGMLFLFLNLVGIIISVVLFVLGLLSPEGSAQQIVMLIISIGYWCLPMWLLLIG